MGRHCSRGLTSPVVSDIRAAGKAARAAVALDPQHGAGAIMQWVVLIAALIASLAGVATALSPAVTDALIEHAAPIMPSCVVLGLAISLCSARRASRVLAVGCSPKQTRRATRRARTRGARSAATLLSCRASPPSSRLDTRGTSTGPWRLVSCDGATRR